MRKYLPLLSFFFVFLFPSCARRVKEVEKMQAISLRQSSLAGVCSTFQMSDIDLDIMVIHHSQKDTTQVVGRISKKTEAKKLGQIKAVQQDTIHKEVQKTIDKRTSPQKAKKVPKIPLIICFVVFLCLFLHRERR